MPVKLKWENLDVFKGQFKMLPGDLRNEAAPMIRAATYAAASGIRAGYPVGPTGTLAGRVEARVRYEGAWGIVGQVRSGAPHSHLYEKGTKPRYAITRHKKVMRPWANRGRMPAAPPGRSMIPKMIAAREFLEAELAGLLTKHGFAVHGGA